MKCQQDTQVPERPTRVAAGANCDYWFAPGRAYDVCWWTPEGLPVVTDDYGDSNVLRVWVPSAARPVAISDTPHRETPPVEPTFGALPVAPDHVSITGGLRRNAGKLAVHLVPPVLMRAVAAVLGKGAEKYAPRNWELGMEYSTAYASLTRHCLAFWDGENVDPESGQHHMAHVATNAAFILEYARRIEAGTLPAALDDRP